jgi:hypothetical protein
VQAQVDASGGAGAGQHLPAGQPTARSAAISCETM